MVGGPVGSSFPRGVEAGVHQSLSRHLSASHLDSLFLLTFTICCSGTPPAMRVSLTFHRADGSLSAKQHPQNSGKIYLPDGQTYVTKTKSGKPILARKKGDRVLREHGFDVLGQSFALPSRVDFKPGQSPAAVAPAARVEPSRGTASPRLIEIDSDEEEIILAARMKRLNQDSARSSSRSTGNPRSILRRVSSSEPQFPKDTSPWPVPTTKHEPSVFSRDMSRASSLSRGRSPTRETSERRRFAVHDSNNSSPSEFDSLGSYFVPVASPQYNPHAVGHTMTPSQNPFTVWSPVEPCFTTPSVADSNAPCNMPAQHAVYRAGNSVPAASHGMQHTHAPLQYMKPSHPVTFMPPPPPPPPGFVAVGQGASTGGNKNMTGPDQEEEQIKEHFETVVKPTLAPDERDGKTKKFGEHQSLETAKKHKGKSDTKPSEVTLRMDSKHKHVCAGCGSTRSKHYHVTHPLKKGEIPETSYCRRCVAEAEYTDSEAGESIDDKRHTVVGTSCDTIC
jgi:hypothetical protein